MESWASENALIRLISGVYAALAVVALLVLSLMVFLMLGALGSVLFGSASFSGYSMQVTVVVLWVGAAWVVAIKNFSWSAHNIRIPEWHPIGLVTITSVLITVTCPFVWAG